MPLIKVKERTIELGIPEVCGTVEMTAKQCLTGEEREYIDAAIADLETDAQLASALADSYYKENKSFQKGDFLDYLMDATRLSNAMREKIAGTAWVEKLQESEAFSDYIKASNGVTFARLKAFLELRATDPAFVEALKALSLDEALNPETGLPAKLWDYVLTFYFAEQQVRYYQNDLVLRNGAPSFLSGTTTFVHAKPTVIPELNSASLTQNCTLQTLDTDPVLEDGLNSESMLF